MSKSFALKTTAEGQFNEFTVLKGAKGGARQSFYPL